MRFKKMIFMVLFTVLISATSIVSFADNNGNESQENSNDIIVTWQDDLDKSSKGKLTIQQYDVDDLYFASQGTGSSSQNRITNERIWENESIIFSDERIKSETYYVDGHVTKKTVGLDPKVLFYKDSGYFGDESKQSLKAWGYFVPSKSGYYKFKMVSDDGSYLSMFIDSERLNDLQGNEEILVDDMSVSSYNANVSKSVYLEAKKPYPILVKYFNWGGDGLFTFNTSYSKKGNWNHNTNYAPVNKNNLYPSKKTKFFLTYGDVQNLKNIQVRANDKLSLLEGQSSLEIDRLIALLEESNKTILEYYNYTQEKMDEQYDDIEAAMLQLGDAVVSVNTPYPDDILLDEKGTIRVQKYIASDINAGNEGSGYSNNVATWTNEEIIFNPDRKDGPSKLYTAEIEKSQRNAAVEEIFFYDGGGNYGYNAKEIREGWGYFVPNQTGYYQFESLYDDGIRAYLYTNKQVNYFKYTVNESTKLASHYAIGVFSRASSVIRLEAGEAYPIYINHFNWAGPNKLALRYRFDVSANGVNGSYKDVPASWFYGSDKDDFFEIHGDITPVINKKVMLEDALAKASSNMSDVDKAKFNVLISRAETMIDKYYNYTDDEINSFITDADNLLEDNNYNIKIRKYIENDREYIEIIEPFSNGGIDSQILTLMLSDSGASKKPSVVNGELVFTGRTRFTITEKLKDYDYIEITIDQPYAATSSRHPYAGLGVSVNNPDYKVIEFEYLKKIKNGRNENMKLDFGKIKYFNSNGNTSFSTKLIAKKQSNGEFDINIKLYPMGQITEDKVLVSIDDKINVYDFENIYLGSIDYNRHNYKLDNLKILAYKELVPFDVDIKNFAAETSGTFIKLTWDALSETFDSYVIKEFIDGVLIKEHDVDNSAAKEYSVSLSGITVYSDRTFEIYAKKNTSYSTKKTTTWQGGVSFLSITNFKASTNGSDIVLKWDALDSKLIDKYVIKEITEGHASTLSSTIDKTAKTYTLPLIPYLVKRTFTIEAFRGTEKNKAATAIWENDLSAVTIKNFKVVKDASDLILTWDKVTGDFDEFEIIEVISGSSDVIAPQDAAKDAVTKTIALGKLVGDRTFTIVAKKGILKSASSTVVWNDEFADLVITAFTAKANGDKIVLTWDQVTGDFDSLLVTQIGSSIEGKTPGKMDTTIEFDLGDSTATREFTIHAVLDGRSSANDSTTWSVSQNSMTVNQISGHTGKKLGTLVFEGNVNQTIIANASVANYRMEGFNGNSITFKIESTKQKLNVMYIKSTDSNVDESNWKAEALESINRYATAKKIDFYDDSFYATIYKTNLSESATDEEKTEAANNDAANITEKLLEDFKRILATAGLTDIRDKNLEAYKEAILAGSLYPNIEALQAVIDVINGPIDTTNKDKDDDEYIDLIDNTKFTTHGSDFGLATEINITKDPIYNPRFEFELQGNEYLTYENPTVYIYDSNKKRVSSKATIEYDVANYKYSIVIIPTGPEGVVMTQGRYYVNLDTKTEVNTEVHSLDYIIANNSDSASKSMIKKNWHFAYLVSDIEIGGKKITEGLSTTMTIKYNTSETSTIEEVIKSKKINFKIENTKMLPGGF